MKMKWTWMVAGFAAVGALGLAIAGPAAGIKVETAPVTRGRISATVDEEGRTRVQNRYVIASPVTGRVERIVVLEGHQVSRGELLARVHPAPSDPREAGIARGQLEAAEARRLDATTQLQKARLFGEQTARELERAQNLLKGGAISEEATEQARLAATAAGRDIEGRQAALRAAEADVAAARAALIGISPASTAGAIVEVRASAAGRVLRVLQQSTRVVAAGTPLVELGDAAGLEVIVDVLSEDAVKIQPDNPVTIDQWGGDTTLQGRVRWVEPEAFTKTSALGVDEQRVNVVVDLVDPPASLGAGYRLEAHIVIWSGEDVIGVPTSALFQHEAGWAAFVVQNGRAQRRAVRIGHRSTDTAEVLEGLAEGDEVILYPSTLIEDGVRVR